MTEPITDRELNHLIEEAKQARATYMAKASELEHFKRRREEVIAMYTGDAPFFAWFRHLLDGNEPINPDTVIQRMKDNVQRSDALNRLDELIFELKCEQDELEERERVAVRAVRDAATASVRAENEEQS